MKLILLAAGKGCVSFSNDMKVPKCLVKIDNDTILDKYISSCNQLNIKDINLVGGFEILKIMELYPKIKYFYNKNWKNTKSLYSLSKTFDSLSDGVIISYSDTIHSLDTLKLLTKNQEKCNVIFDSEWQTRYENRDSENFEKVYDKNNNFLGEFAGLIFIPKSELERLKIVSQELLNKNIKATVLNLVDVLIKKSEVNLIDIQGNWAELDSVQDIEHFKFSTKAETLQTLQHKVKLSNILEQFTFTVDNYLKNKNSIIRDIQNQIKSKLLVVRSSALNEDTHDSSMAGNFESILKVLKDDDLILTTAIDKVVKSYTKNKQKQDGLNQILVQPYLENVTMSGVVFTKDLQTSSPYYIVNYDESDDTEAVTSGNGSDLSTFICYKNYKSKIINHKLDVLITGIKELENITRYDAIDVEFAFVEDKLFILQVRPIAASKDSIKVSENDVDNELESLRSYLKNNENPSHLLGNSFAYGVMPDWNPAEIIGINPKPLAFDLYKYIITDNIWSKSRKELGYRDVGNNVGLVSFMGKPYVDIRMSFNTFIPAGISEDIAEKLIDYFISKLKNEPHNHDKVEFNTVITAFDFDFENKKNELLANGFNQYEIEEIEENYKNLTQDIILGKNKSIDSELKKLKILALKREEVEKSELDIFDKIYNLLEDCKNYGTLPFSNLARFGFIGSIFLKSLLAKGAVSQDEYDLFFKSIHTVAKSFLEDFNLLLKGKLSKEEFILSYGHLRPGTYEIVSPSYKDNFDSYIDQNSKVHKIDELENFSFSIDTKSIISDEIKKHNLDFSVEELLLFIREATEAREKAKFEFTKSLSLVLELIEEVGKKYNIPKEDLSYLNICECMLYKNTSSRIDIFTTLRQNISNNKQKYLLTSAIQLPELIFDKIDVDMFFYSSLKPNFVTHQSIISDTVVLENSSELSIDNKIVFIENADPGFDWIFSHNIKGLVTKYGGAASHMAIRCAEFDLPAAIGCGDKIFNELIKYNKINLDCVNQKITGLR